MNYIVVKKPKKRSQCVYEYDYYIEPHNGIFLEVDEFGDGCPVIVMTPEQFEEYKKYRGTI